MEAILNLSIKSGKTLVATGAAIVASLSVHTHAQSVGIGFHLVDLPQGSSLVSNPFQSGNNLISDLFIDVPDGFSVSKLIDGQWLATTWSSDSASWSAPEMTLSPGEGARVDAPEAYQWFTSGKPLIGQLSSWVPAGDSARGSRLAVSGLVMSELGLSAPDGTTLFDIDSEGNTVSLAVFADGVWIPEEPQLEVGDAVIINAPEGFDWSQALDVDGIVNPLSFSEQPVDASLTEGGVLTLSALAEGADAIAYQWQKNGNDIPGARGATLTIDSVAAADAGQYAVVASTLDSALRSEFASVTVEPAVVEPTTGPVTAVSVSEDGRLIEITITGEIGQAYQVQATEDFVEWFNRGSTITNETGTVTHSERIAPRRSRYFRAVVAE